MLSAETEAWLRDGYRARMSTAAVLRDLGPILAHGEPDDGIGQGESTDARRPPGRRRRRARAGARAATPAGDAADGHGNGNGELVTIDFGGARPRRAARAA